MLLSSKISSGKGRKPYPQFRLSCIACIMAIAASLACSQTDRRPLPAGEKLYLPECVILQSDSPQENSDGKAYAEALEAVALSPRMESPAAIEKLAASNKHVILIIPLPAARLLSLEQMQNVLRLVENGAVLVTEGITPLSEKLGFRAGPPVEVKQLQELAYPEVEISWETEERVTSIRAPDKTIVLNREQNSAAPMVCLLPRGRGHCLLLATSLRPRDREAYARFPYFLHELRRAGAEFPYRSDRLSALFDYGYRAEEDPENLAVYYKRIGIRDLHVGAWDFFDGDPKAEAYLRKLIDACHRNGILVYAWLELPHVSTRFWNKHPQWREKTATGRDAHVDWRFVMNLNDPECFRTVANGLEKMLRHFDWDGVNLSELYFDGPSGPKNPANFTPLNSFVRSEFKKQSGIDPIDLFKKDSRFYWKKNAAAWKSFVEYRVALEKDMNERFIRLFSGFRGSFSPNLDIFVTYVDNIYDSDMREAVGADVSLMFGLLNQYNFTLVLEDPATVWHLGPRRYAELAQTYEKMTRKTDRLGVDINIIKRNVQTYPTDKQTGTEFLQLFFNAGRHFRTVMVYSEYTMLPHDAALVSCALAPDVHAEVARRGIQMSTTLPIVYRSGLKQKVFEVDGNPWPCSDEGDIRLPAGSHSISVGMNMDLPRPRLVKLNGDLLGARYVDGKTIEFSYSTKRRAIAVFDRAPHSLQVDEGARAETTTAWVMLPRGSHKIKAGF
jgi:hypothetical protein